MSHTLPSRDEVDIPSLVVGLFVGLAGLLFLVEPVVDPLTVGAVRVRPVALSVVALTVGFALGAVVYGRRGQRLIGLAHGVGAVGWGLIAGGTAVGNGSALLFGVAVLVGGSIFLVSQAS